MAKKLLVLAISILVCVMCVTNLSAQKGKKSKGSKQPPKKVIQKFKPNSPAGCIKALFDAINKGYYETANAKYVAKGGQKITTEIKNIFPIGSIKDVLVRDLKVEGEEATMKITVLLKDGRKAGYYNKYGKYGDTVEGLLVRNEQTFKAIKEEGVTWKLALFVPEYYGASTFTNFNIKFEEFYIPDEPPSDFTLDALYETRFGWYIYK